LSVVWACACGGGVCVCVVFVVCVGVCVGECVVFVRWSVFGVCVRFLLCLCVSKGKGKGRFSGFIRHRDFVQAYCTLAPRNFLPSPLEALCISQTHRALC
jgi:hypothetical protein